MKEMPEAKLSDVAGAAYLQVTDEQLPCGIGRAVTWLDGNGVVLRQDYTVFVEEGIFSEGAAQL